MEILLFLGVAAVGAWYAVPRFLRVVKGELARPALMQQVARSLGLSFTMLDPAFPGNSAFHYPFELFSRGVRQTCTNVMSGTLDGISIVAFDFIYVHAVDGGGGVTIRISGSNQTESVSEPIRYTCALATVGGDRPHVVIEAAATPLSERADGEPVQLEWGDFNARYRAVSADRAFATALLDVDVMAWLVDSAPHLPLTWEVQRDQVLCRAPTLDPDQVPELVRAVAAFAKRISPGATG